MRAVRSRERAPRLLGNLSAPGLLKARHGSVPEGLAMADIFEPKNYGEGKHGHARSLADAAIVAQREGRGEDADRLFAEATRTDPQAVEEALAESEIVPGDRGAKLDAAENGRDAEVAAITRTVQPSSDAPSRSGITGPGSGADAS
jgi:hypothetical protein